MAEFLPAVAVVLKHEGGYVDDPDDPGQETNFGLSTLFIRRAGLTAADLGLPSLERGALKSLTREKAVEVYRLKWWDNFKYGDLIEQRIATKLFDTCVNVGPQAHKWAQTCCNQLGASIAVDGLLGEMSFHALNSVATLPWLTLFSQRQAAHYRALCEQNPVLRKYLNGNWLRRAAWLGES